MSFFALATGVLIADPQRRTAANGNQFATGQLRVPVEGEPVIVSVIAFGDEAARILEFSKGYPLSVSGKVRPTSWTGRDGIEKHGLTLVVGEIAGLKPPRAGGRAKLPKNHTYPKHRLARAPADHAPELPADTVQDLFI